MTYKDILSMSGGLALFLYGMHVMGDGLSKLAGGKLEKILEKLTSKRIYAVLLGILVTAVIQSSSATTVMVVGFVNSNIMTLNQAVGIIMGANVGTTVTSWLLSLVGLQGESVIMNLLKPESLASICALIGILIIMSKGKERKKDIGNILLGFAILMFGMETMSSAVAPLADDPRFTSILTVFSNPVMGIVAGAVLTAIIQSSSASVGILQALCSTGALNYSFAFPVIMGQNIGTCVTSIISSIGANVNARRASFIHLFFNLIGTAIFVTVFYLLNGIFHFDFYNATATTAGIAVIHSIFNITVTILLYPFADLLVKLVTVVIKDDHEEDENNAFSLDKRFLNKPDFALERARQQMAIMTEEVCGSCLNALNQLSDYNGTEAQKIYDTEENMDKFEDAMASYLINISKNSLSYAGHHQHAMIQYNLKDLERITDYASMIAKSIQKLAETDRKLPEQFLRDMEPLIRAEKTVIKNTSEVLKNGDVGVAMEIEPLLHVVSELCHTIRNRHLERMNGKYCDIETGMEIEDIMNCFKRMADHCGNIAITVIEISNNTYEKHSYRSSLRESDETTFVQIYEAMKKEYSLDDSSANINTGKEQ